MKRSLIILLLITLNLFSSFSQIIEEDYRTTLDSIARLHFIRFNNDGTVLVRFFGFPSNVMFPSNQVFCNYVKKGDTIVICQKDTNKISVDNVVINRLYNSILLIKSENILFDINSGYTYLSNSVVNKYHMNDDDAVLLVINERQFNYKHGRNPFLKFKIWRLDSKNLKTEIIKGPKAYDCYGIKGINGILVVNDK